MLISSDTISIHADETKGDQNSFFITTSIWGFSHNCGEYERTIKSLIAKHRRVLGKDFKGFRANKLQLRNWTKLSPIYLEVVHNLLKFIEAKKLRCLIYIESQKKNEMNSQFLRQILRDHLPDKSNPLGEIFQYTLERDLTAIYERADKLYNYLYHRKTFGSKNQTFNYFPDSSGKILKYKNKKIPVMATSPINYGTIIFEDFFRVLTWTANALANAMSNFGWHPNYPQTLLHFEPLRDEDSILIQTADMISNFILHVCRSIAGTTNHLSVLKSNAILQFKVFDKLAHEIKDDFQQVSGKCICVNDELKATLTLLK